MKKFKILNNPTSVKDIQSFEDTDLLDTTELKSEKLNTKELRKFRRQLV